MPTPEPTDRSALTRFAWLSIAAALATMGLKAAAFLLTGSVGLLSDALESGVNLAGALMALAMLTIAARPEDEEHAYGHSKAEYFASGVEGTLILVAAATIAYESVRRFRTPHPLEQLGVGLAVSVAASAVNLGVALVLRRAGTRSRSITLEANAAHLLTDVWTSAGVLVGVGAVALTGWAWLDPLIALVVAANIVWTGGRIVRESVLGLMDTAIPAAELDALRQVLTPMPGTACSTTRCAPGSPAPAASCRSTCWSPATGRSIAATSSWSGSKPTSAASCRTRTSSPTWSRSTIRRPGRTSAWTARSEDRPANFLQEIYKLTSLPRPGVMLGCGDPVPNCNMT